MKEKGQEKRKNWRKLWFWLLLALIISGIVTWRQSGMELETVETACTDGTYIYGTESRLEGSYLFRTPIKGGSSDLIFQPLEVEGELCLIEDAVLVEGELWAIRSRYSADWAIQEKDLVRCDFDQGIFGEIHELGGPDGENPVLGLLPFKEAEDGFYLLRQGQGQEVLVSNLTGEDGAYRLPEYTVVVQMIKEGKLGCVDSFGDIYIAGTDGQLEKIYSNDGTKISKSNSLYYFEENQVIFRNLDSHATYAMSYDSGNPVQVPDGGVDRAEAYGYAAKLHQRDQSGALYTVYGGENRLYPVWTGEKTVAVQRLIKPWETLTKIFLQTAAAVLGLALLAKLGYWFVLKISNGIFPTSVKIICAIVPLVVVGYFLMISQLLRVFGSRFYEQEKTRVYYGAEMLANSVTADEWRKNQTEPVFFWEQAWEKLGAQWNYKELFGIEGEKAVQARENRLEGFFYRAESGNFYLLDYAELMYVPVEYTYMGNFREILARCVLDKNIQIETRKDAQKGQTLSAFAPVQDEDGQVIGVVHVSLNMEDILEAVRAKIEKIAVSMCLFFAGMVLVFPAIVIPSLRPLKRMRLATEKLSAGRHGEPIRVWGSQEVAEILQMFNFMVENLERYLRRSQRLRSAYEPFVPQGMVKFLEKEDVRGVEPGDCSEFWAEVMTFRGSDEFPASFEELNVSLSRLVSGSEACGGWVESFQSDGGRVFFADTKASVKAAIEIHRQLEGLGQKFHIGICEGMVRLRVVGTRDRMETAVFSQAQEISEALCKLAARYGIRILAAKSVAKRDEKTMKERSLGCLRLWDGTELFVCEIYHADTPVQIRLKDETRNIFEMGTEFFWKREWREARNCFAQVLRRNREDMAASRYFSLCDMRLEEKDAGEQTGYFEQL